MAIPVDAPHPHNAMLWINYILRPEGHASLTNKVFYANPNSRRGCKLRLRSRRRLRARGGAVRSVLKIALIHRQLFFIAP